MAGVEHDETQRPEVEQQLRQPPPVEKLAAAVNSLEEEGAFSARRRELPMPHEMEDVKGLLEQGLTHPLQASTLQEHDLDLVLLATPGRLEVRALAGDGQRRPVARAGGNGEDAQPARAGERRPSLAVRRE